MLFAEVIMKLISPKNPTIVVITAKREETVLHATSAATDGFCLDLGKNCKGRRKSLRIT